MLKMNIDVKTCQVCISPTAIFNGHNDFADTTDRTSWKWPGQAMLLATFGAGCGYMVWETCVRLRGALRPTNTLKYLRSPSCHPFGIEIFPFHLDPSCSYMVSVLYTLHTSFNDGLRDRTTFSSSNCPANHLI